MKVINENNEKIILELSKDDYYNLQNYFFDKPQKYWKENLSNEVYNSILNFVNLEGVESGLFSEIKTLLDKSDLNNTSIIS